jgi:hypothetical protein
MMEQLLDGRAIDWILGLVIVEGAALVALRALAGRGPASLPLLGNLLSGAFLLLALRNALAGGSPATIGLCLIASLVAHIADLVGRWEGLASRVRAPARRPDMRATLSLRVSKTRIRPAPRAPNDESSDA